MLKNLFKTERQQGFTLVELLVAIAIIAILAVIGLTVFTGLQRGARDATRRSDVQAISKALEANYNTANALYVPLTSSQFAGNVIPQDPINGQTSCNSNGVANLCSYCITSVTGGGANPTGALVTSAPACGSPGTASLITSASTGVPPITATGYVVCANMETGSSPFYCQGSQR